MFTKPDIAFDPNFESVVALALAGQCTVRIVADPVLESASLASLINGYNACLSLTVFPLKPEVLAMRLAARGVKVELRKQ